MSVRIRAAKSEDAPAIASIGESALDQSIDHRSPRVRMILGEGRTWVALLQREVVGFVDGFFTGDAAGEKRYELDLLAVAPHAQGLGLGSRLVAQSVAAAAAAGAKTIRALVRCGNRPMQRLCRRDAFVRSSDGFHLYVAAPRPTVERGRHHRARLIAVETLSYSGIWLEGELSQEAIEAAHCLASQNNGTTIGAVIPGSASDDARLLGSNSFQKVGNYHWWAIKLTGD